MGFREYRIEITGNAHAKEGKHYAQNWAAGSVSDGEAVQMDRLGYDSKKHSITGNVVFDKHLRAVPYACYVANGSVDIDRTMDPNADFSCCSGFDPAFSYFNEYIADLRSSLDVPIDERVAELYYNGLYISAFGILELFLCDFLLCGVFWKEGYYLNALTKLGVKLRPDQFLVEEKIKNAIYNKVFHRFDEIQDIFDFVFGFGFPDWTELDKRIDRRHNIIHRFALSKENRMVVDYATREDVEDLIQTIEKFVEDMKVLCVRA